ncbi:PRD domain-containing protein [Niallia sp. FSL W8-0635]|uniref:PRD domain-containing protein n=1 Tax=Niallia sp. FSL W8-0635 TaxID=2975337 RepID=UPI0030F9359C
MKSEAERMILHLLLNVQTSLEDIESDNGITQDKTKECIRIINRKLSEFKETKISINSSGEIMISPSTKEALYLFLKENIFQSDDYLLPELREQLITIKLLLSKDGFSLLELASFVQVSKNTMLNDLKNVKKNVLKESLTLEYSRLTGYQIVGEESRCRQTLVSSLKKILTVKGNLILFKKKLVDKNEIFLMKKRLLTIEKRLGVSFTDEQLEHLPFLLLVLIKRMQTATKSKIEEPSNLVYSSEFTIIKEQFWHIPTITEQDKGYLALQILSANMLHTSYDFLQDYEIGDAIHDFLKEVEKSLAINPIGMEDLKNKLIHHLKLAIFRTKYSLSIKNNLTEEFIKEYPSIFAIVKKSIRSLEHITNSQFSDDEIIYIAMHFQAWVYQSNEGTNTSYKALVVCRNGVSVSKMLLASLRDYFPFVHFIGAYSERTFSEVEEDVDFIFSTVELITKKKVFLTNPILNKTNCISLEREVHQYIDTNIQLRSSKLTNHLSKYIPKKNLPIVKQIITEFMNDSYKLTKSKIEEIISPIFPFSKENILFNYENINWEEAVELSFQPLLNRKSVTNSYVKNTINSFRKDGSHMVIGPEVYLPHAPTYDGALRNDFCMLICKEPIKINKKDRANIIIALSPSRNNSHVPTLLHLNKLFLDNHIYQSILYANDEAEVINLIKP